jgi:microcystin-dependent protein
MVGGVVGFVTLFAGNFEPSQWAYCNGQLMSISQNQALFSLLGNVYGGDGVSTFALPDLRGRSIVGVGQGITFYKLGQKGGAETNIIPGGSMPVHSHPINVAVKMSAAGTPNSVSPANATYATSTSTLYGTTGNAGLATYPGVATMGDTGNGTPFPDLHPVLAMNYIICLSGLFPKRSE